MQHRTQPVPDQGATGELSAAVGTSVLAGLIGQGIQKSRTPRLHEAEGQRIGMRYIYRLLDTDQIASPTPDLGTLITAAELCGFSGLNITFPYKREAMEHVDELSDSAHRVGAINTVVFRDGKRFGHNTDLWGFKESFRQDMPDAPLSNVLLLGAGGAGAAVAYALSDCGTKRLMIHDIHLPSAAALVTKLNDNAGGKTRFEVVEDPAQVIATVDGIVNATPIGMEKCPGVPIEPEHLRADMWVADIVYFPLETQLLRAAREKGCRVLPGSGMAIFQAVRAFELFSGHPGDAQYMKAEFDAFQ